VIRDADVIVVGGGVVGCSIAYRLAERGTRVLLLEKRGLASGASGRNNGTLGVGSKLLSPTGRAVYALTSANLALMRQLPDELGVDFDLRLTGTLDIATTPEQYEHLASSVAAQGAGGLDVELLDRHQTRSLVPALTESIVGSAFSHGGGHFWPYGLNYDNEFSNTAADRHVQIVAAMVRDGL
jgi:glycine/D-amino acid oxidase-like deaminating enzyme